MARWYPAVVMALVLLGSAPVAHAQRSTRTDREARSLFEAGQEAFGSGNYELALEQFERAYALSHRSGLLYNIAVTADRMRNDARALEAFREYLASEPETERRAEVEARIAYLEQPAEPEPVEPVAPAPVAPVEPEPPPPAAPSGVHPAGVITLVAAGALLASFGVFAVLSELEDEALATRCGRDVGAGCTASEVQSLEVFNVVADVSWIAGTAVAVAGVVLLLALPPEGESSTGLAFAPWVQPDGAGATVVGRW